MVRNNISRYVLLAMLLTPLIDIMEKWDDEMDVQNHTTTICTPHGYLVFQRRPGQFLSNDTRILLYSLGTNYKDNDESMYVFYTFDIYYRTTDSVIDIVTPRCYIITPILPDSVLQNIRLHELEYADTISKWEHNYKAKGFEKISIDDIINNYKKKYYR